MRRLLVTEYLAVVALAVLGALSFHRVFIGNGFAGPAVGAAVASVGIAALANWRGLTRSSSAVASAISFVVFAIYAALPETAPNVVPTPSTFRELFGGLTSGWADLLTVSLPARAEPRLLVVTIAIVWLGGAFGGELVARSRSSILPTVPPLLAYLASLTFAASEPRSPAFLPASVAAATLAVLLVHANRWALLEPEIVRSRRRAPAPAGRPASPQASVDVPGDRWVLLGLPVIAVAVTLGVVVADVLPSRDGSFDPRSFRTQQVEREIVTTPLASVKAELQRNVTDPPVVLTIETESFRDARSVPLLRLAVLDTFDGATWSSSARYSKVGSVLPVSDDLDVSTRDVRQRITLRNFDLGPWLPAADRPIGIDLGEQDVPIGYDSGSGTIIAENGIPEGLTYEIVSQVAVPTDEELSAAVPLTGPEVENETAIAEGLPDALRLEARSLAAGAGSSPYDQLKALEAGLRSRYGYNEDVSAGHSYGRLARFVEDRRGYAEQFAATFALMARALGFPARLSVGYLTTAEPDEGGELEVLTEITSRETHVWPEVAFAGIGWVAFEPTPDRVASSPAPEQEATGTTIGGGLVEAQPVNEVGGGTSSGGSEPDEPLLSGPILGVLALLLAFVLAMLAMLLAKALLLRHRRRRENPAAQVLGAWASVTDRLIEVGVPIDPSMTAREVVWAAGDRSVAPEAVERLHAMVPLVTLALYAPAEPPRERALEMWKHADAFRREVLIGQPWWTAMTVALNPKPLVNSLGRR